MKIFGSGRSASGVMVLIAVVSLSIACGSYHSKEPLQVPSGSWGLVFPVSDRFLVAMSGEAVYDRETGLVWERSPHSERMNWTAACAHCYRNGAGQRLGWRLPTIEELSSLVDESGLGPALPPGHPFENIHRLVYWSSTTDNDYDGMAWRVYFDDGRVGSSVKSIPYSVWCVRGGKSPR